MSFGPKAHEVRGALGPDPNFANEVVLTGSQAQPKAGRGWKDDRPNAGYSGKPLWKLKLEKEEAAAAAAANPAIRIPDGFKQHEGQWYWNEKQQLFWNASDHRMYVWDDAAQKRVQLHEAMTYELRISVGGVFHEAAMQVKHVLVRDLTKAGQALRMSIDHLDRPCALYAVYDGHRGSSGAGKDNACSNFCAKHLHEKLLPKLTKHKGYWEDERLAAAMRESFLELDAEFVEKHPSTTDGCCAAVALITGNRLVVGSLGDVAIVVCHRDGEVTELVKPHSVPDPDDEDSDGGGGPPGAASSAEAPAIRWTRAFGDADLKEPDSSPRLEATPDVQVLQLQRAHHGFAFICRALYRAVGGSPAVSTVFRRSAGRPRMASGAFVDAAVQWLGEVGDVSLGSIVVFFDRAEVPDELEPPAKRPKKEAAQVRLRHVLVKHRECKSTVDKVRNRQVKRPRGEAERLLRAVLEECEGDPQRHAFTKRCRELSECPSSMKAGDLAGDLGWVKPGKFGQAFDDAAFLLQVGQLSDLIDSDQGIHVILRTA